LDIVGQYFTHSLDSITIAITHQRKNKKKKREEGGGGQLGRQPQTLKRWSLVEG
jgi:hypothetical protein